MANNGDVKARKQKAKAKKAKAEETSAVPEWDDGGFTLRSVDEDAGLEKAKAEGEANEVPECDPWGFSPGVKKKKSKKARREEELRMWGDDGGFA